MEDTSYGAANRKVLAAELASMAYLLHESGDDAAEVVAPMAR